MATAKKTAVQKTAAVPLDTKTKLWLLIVGLVVVGSVYGAKRR